MVEGMEGARVAVDHRETVEFTTVAIPGWVGGALAETLEPGLSDPELQAEFANHLPNSLAPSVLYRPGDPARINVEY
jgi:hypothetical protein